MAKYKTKYKNGEVLALLYDVWISGTKLSMNKKACITNISYKESVVGSDTLTFTIADPKFIYIEDNIFLEDNKIKVKMGWSNTTHRITFEGYISAIDIEFNSDGIPVLSVMCMDKTHIMNREKKSATFTDCTNADAVKRIASSYGFSVVVESGYDFTFQETITQSNMTDIAFIQNLASNEVYPFTARLVGNTFYYVKMGKLGASKMDLTYLKYPHEVISFSPKINKETKQVAINNASVDTGSKAVSTTTGSVDSSSGSASSGGSGNSATANKSGYTYDPSTGKWTK